MFFARLEDTHEGAAGERKGVFPDEVDAGPVGGLDKSFFFLGLVDVASGL